MAEESSQLQTRVGDFTSKLAVSFATHLDLKESTDGVDQSTPLSAALKAVDLNISSNQVQQLLEASKNLRVHEQSKSGCGLGEGLSWGEFCVYCVELHELKTKHLQKPNLERTADKESLPRVSHQATPTKCHTSHQAAEVFLGGSCNPTTWRRDLAIPALHEEGVTYYNPQVEEWYPELIEVEERAKDSASLLFFVIDSQTRAVSSMVEIAFFAGIGRDLVVVVDDISTQKPKIGDDTPSPREVEDLNRGRAFVRSLLEAGGSVLATEVEEGIRVTAKILKQDLTVREYSSRYQSVSVPHGHSLGERLTLLRQVFIMYDTQRKGSLSLQETELALRSVHIDSGAMHNQLSCKRVEQTIRSSDLLSRFEEQGLSFDEFCAVYAELRYAEIAQESGVGSLLVNLAYFTSPLLWISGWLWPTTPPTPPQTTHYDIFLGGSCGNTSWRTDTAIPLLRQNGISYFNPQVSHWDVRMIPIERDAKENSSVLLFVVSGDTLSVASMVEVAYYIGAGRKIVLCLVDIPSDGGAEIEGMKLSARAIKDYNRGRAYLASLANKNRIPIYTTVTDTVHRAVHLLRGHFLPSSGADTGTSV